MELDGRVAIVTGGAGGLGRAIAGRLETAGATVVRADVAGGDALVDVTDAGSAEALAAETLARHGRLDVLVNNAGIAGPSGPVSELDPAEWRRVLDVNLTGVFHCTRACLPALVERGWGRVVNVSSIAGLDGNPFMAAYSASKAGVVAFTRAVAKEVAATGVLVNCVVPAALDGGLTDAASDDERELFRSRIPMGRLGRPEELAELVAWLASPRCSFSTGAVYDLTGGRNVH
ncbi:MAG TPA: SDR family NAD(P)-dependent oxidoreductase [Gaiellaceae bacterium]|jgi:3-oxoacyl-[acyl-carrier protein] reductase|nr:SDR family NAD(P)-dependent oxidoreductase [Gaiellaceae bacterium]